MCLPILLSIQGQWNILLWIKFWIGISLLPDSQNLSYLKKFKSHIVECLEVNMIPKPLSKVHRWYSIYFIKHQSLVVLKLLI